VHSSGVILLVAIFLLFFNIKVFEEKLGGILFIYLFSKQNFATFSEIIF
jgi:hypothetical protein